MPGKVEITEEALQYAPAASFHMLDAYDESVEWVCECRACSAVRGCPALRDAMNVALKSKPSKPSRKQVSVAIIEMENDHAVNSQAERNGIE